MQDTSNRHHANRPTPVTPADLARMNAAIARHDKRRASQAAKTRLFRLAYSCAAVALLAAFFYSL